MAFRGRPHIGANVKAQFQLAGRGASGSRATSGDVDEHLADGAAFDRGVGSGALLEREAV
jgi:7-keto-8-aminopelargonate synthetase-like enzyme